MGVWGIPHRELLAADPRHQVFVAHRRFEDACHVAERAIARRERGATSSL